ncbi:MAG: hypothetical protein ACRCVT_01420 [Leadbetterella sp.]
MGKTFFIVFFFFVIFECNKEAPNVTFEQMNKYFHFYKPSEFLCEKKKVGGKDIFGIGSTDFVYYVFCKPNPEDTKAWIKKLEPFQNHNFERTSKFSIRKWYPESLVSNLNRFNKKELDLERTKFYTNVPLVGLNGSVLVLEDNHTLFVLGTN